jgi:hypothetical protein
MSISLRFTRRFSVYSLPCEVSQNLDPECVNCTTKSLKSLRFFVRKRLERNGYTVIRDIFDKLLLLHAKEEVKRFFSKKLLPIYDEVMDEFDGFDLETNNITRLPRIGRGKHNVHFDPEFSSCHTVLANLLESSSLLEALSYYMGGKCSLRETGLSVTRPHLNSLKLDETSR